MVFMCVPPFVSHSHIITHTHTNNAQNRYCPGFREIGDEFGPFDVAAIPIGAYVPRWFMRDQHIDPQVCIRVYVCLHLWLCICVCASATRTHQRVAFEGCCPPLSVSCNHLHTSIYLNTQPTQAALDVAQDVQAQHSFGIHWGTFPLAGDAWDEGARELIQVGV